MRAANLTCSTLLIIVMGISASITPLRPAMLRARRHRRSENLIDVGGYRAHPVLHRYVCTAIRNSICMMSWRPTDRIK